MECLAPVTNGRGDVCAFAEVTGSIWFGSVRFGLIQMRAQDVLCIASWEGDLVMGAQEVQT